MGLWRHRPSESERADEEAWLEEQMAIADQANRAEAARRAREYRGPDVYACNHGQFETPCPGGCHNEMARLGLAAGTVLAFERDQNSAAARRLVEIAGTSPEELAKLGPDVVELYRYNADPWPWMRGATA